MAPMGRTYSCCTIALLTLLGCGGSEDGGTDGPEVPSAPQSQPRTTAREAAPAGPRGRVFRAQGPARRPDFEEIAAGVDPGWRGDPWPGELLARSVEDLLEGALRHLAEGGDPGALRGLITRDLEGAPQGFPDVALLKGVDFIAYLQGLLRLPEGNGRPVVEVDVLEVEAPPAGGPADGPGAAEGATRVHVRVGTDPAIPVAGPRQQVDLTLDIRWQLGRRSRMSLVSVVRCTGAQLSAPFEESTLTLLDSSTRSGPGDPDLLLGALEAAGRTDALVGVGDILTAMHGVAAGDLDGDGRDDLVVARAGGQPNQVWMNRGTLREEGAARGLDWLEDSGGVLIVDLDGDGARDVAMGVGPDVVVAWNDGAGSFQERTVLPRAGAARVYSLAAADVDSDGDLDLYDTRYFRAGDYGAQAPTPYHDAENGASNVLWRNLLADAAGPEPRRFRDDTAAMGLDVDNDRFSMVAVFDDLNADGRLDLYVANDFGRNNLYLRGESGFIAAPDGPLTDKAAGMGISVADADLDGHDDILISNMYSAAGGRVTRDRRFLPGASAEVRGEFVRHARGNSIFHGVGGGEFEDRTLMTGAAPGGWAWGARFVDWDRDGLPEMVVPNGFLSGREGPDLQSFFWRRVVGASPMSIESDPAALDRYLGAWSVISHLSQFGRQDWNARERTFAYRNKGELEFEDVSLASGLGFADDGRSLAVADLDHDGRLDLVFRNRTAPILRVFRGRAEGGRAVSLRLEQPGPNQDGVGALITLETDEGTRRARIRAGDGFLGSSPAEAFFGLGDSLTIEAVTVDWPDGTRQRVEVPDGQVLAGSAWTLVRGESRPRLRYPFEAAPPAERPAPPVPLAGGEPGPPRVRVPLLAEFPLGAWRLPGFSIPAERADACTSERGLLVALWSSAEGGAASSLANLQALEVPVRTISLDGVRGTDAARAAAVELGVESLSGRADAATRLVIDLVMGRVLAPFDDLPLPIGLLLDAQGDLCCLYVGGLPVDLIQEDVGRLMSRADVNGTGALTGGSWLKGAPARDLTKLCAGLRARGFNELADHLEGRRAR